MSKYSAYSVYKDSGVEWLGDVPEHWEVAILKRKFNVQLGKMLQTKPISEADTEEEYLCAVNIQPNGLDLTNIKKMWFSENDKNKYELKKGDLLVSEGGDVGRSAIYDLEQTLYIQNAINRIRPIEKDLTKFLYYWIYSLKIKGYIDIICNKSTISHFTAEKVEAIETLLPPPKEQQQIAAFLDNKTAHLDTLIEKKQQMIGLLNEKRIALITQAVTKGLDLSVPMKYSGVEWLGNVPEHWEKVLIKYLLNSMIDTEHKTAPFFEDGQYFVVRTSNIRNGKLLFNNAKYTDHAGYIEWTRRGKPQAGDILFTREAPTGEACIVPEGIDLCVGQRTVLMQVNPNLLNSKYALWSLYGGLAAEFIKILSQGATVAHFNMSDIGNIPILLPLIDEQQKIVDYLDHETAKIDRMINTIQSAIAKLQEYRTALITAAVTGKIDVRTQTNPSAIDAFRGKGDGGTTTRLLADRQQNDENFE